MRYMNRKALMALGILISIANTDAMNRSTLDSYSMLIVAKHLKSEQDYKRLMQVCKKFKNTCKKFRYNPISITNKTKIFPKIQTHVLYDDEDEISDDFDNIAHTQRIAMSDRVKDIRDNHRYKNIVLDRKYVLQPIFVEKNGVVTIDGARQPTGLERSIFDPVITKLVIGNDNVSPSYAFGDNIREIGAGAFLSAFNIKTIEIKPSIRKIDHLAFANCSFEHLILNEGLFEIWSGAFTNCINLTKLVLPNSVHMLNGLALQGCKNLREITLSSSMTSIAKSTFKSATKLKNIIIPNGVINLGRLCFGNCNQLEEITLPSSVQNVEGEAFNMCTKLRMISFSSDVNFMPSSINECNNLRQLVTPTGWRLYVYEVLNKDKVLLSNGTKIRTIGFVNQHSIDGLEVINDYTYPCRRLDGQEDIFDALNGVKEIDKYTFAKCNSLTSLIIPESVTKICDNSFESCAQLRSVLITDNITKLCAQTFYQCDNLTNIVLSTNLKEIGAKCFSFCENLRGIVIPDSISKIDGYTFAGCTNLRSVQLPKSITSIESFTFKACRSLTRIEIPVSVRHIDFGTFFVCDNLSKIVLLKRKGEDGFRIKNMLQTSMEFSDIKKKLVEIVEIDM